MFSEAQDQTKLRPPDELAEPLTVARVAHWGTKYTSVARCCAAKWPG